MSNTPMPDHAAEDAEGRHRGPASVEETDKSNQPHGKHRRPSED